MSNTATRSKKNDSFLMPKLSKPLFTTSSRGRYVKDYINTLHSKECNSIWKKTELKCKISDTEIAMK